MGGNSNTNTSRTIPSSRSVVKPLLAAGMLIAVAVSVAMLLVHRSQGDDSSSNLTKTIGESKPVVSPKGWTKGNPAAKTVLIEFADFQCGSCANAGKAVSNILKKHENDLFVVFKHFPLETVHKNALIAAQASEAAGKQFKFWEMSETLFKHQVEWANVPDAQTYFLNYAAELQLDVEKFRQDLWDGAIRDKIYRDVLEGQVAQVSQTPTFFLNGSRMPTTKNESEFEETIANAIKAAK